MLVATRNLSLKNASLTRFFPNANILILSPHRRTRVYAQRLLSSFNFNLPRKSLLVCSLSLIVVTAFLGGLLKYIIEYGYLNMRFWVFVLSNIVAVFGFIRTESGGGLRRRKTSIFRIYRNGGRRGV